MSKTTTPLAFAVMMAAGMAVANAQSAIAPTPSPTLRAEMTTDHLLPGQIRVTAMTGAAVYDSQNRNVGKIKDIVLGGDGRVAAVILNVGGTLGVGGRYVAVGIEDLKITNTDAEPHFTVNMSKDQLRTAQTYNLKEAVETGTSTPPADPAR
jgi:sporulation protein YlmC with PRC-barrel domain